MEEPKTASSLAYSRLEKSLDKINELKEALRFAVDYLHHNCEDDIDNWGHIEEVLESC